MNSALWVLQVLFGLFFAMYGGVAMVKPVRMRPQLAKLPYSSAFLSFIGLCEILGALGLLLSMATGVARWLTPLAAAGLAVIMAGAV